MAVLDWSPEKRIVVEVRKALNLACRSGSSTDFARLFPVELPEELEVEHGDSVCVEIKNRNGRLFFFSQHSIYLQTDDRFVRLPYEAIVRNHWIDIVPDAREMTRQKQERGESLTAYDNEGERYELDSLGWMFQGTYAFLQWLKERREKAH